MKKIYTLLVALMAMTMTANAQFQWGVEAGLNLNKMSLSGYLPDVSSNNRTGFFVGPKVKFTLPIVGLGVDGAILYNNREASVSLEEGGSATKTLHTIEIPVNARYTLGLSSIISLYFATGPQWNWNVGNRTWDIATIVDEAGNAVGNLSSEFEKSTFSWNVGVGAYLFSHLQVGVTYNIPISKGGSIFETAANVLASQTQELLSGDMKSNSWQIRAAYFF